MNITMPQYYRHPHMITPGAEVLPDQGIRVIPQKDIHEDPFGDTEDDDREGYKPDYPYFPLTPSENDVPRNDRPMTPPYSSPIQRELPLPQRTQPQHNDELTMLRLQVIVVARALYMAYQQEIETADKFFYKVSGGIDMLDITAYDILTGPDSPFKTRVRPPGYGSFRREFLGSMRHLDYLIESLEDEQLDLLWAWDAENQRLMNVEALRVLLDTLEESLKKEVYEATQGDNILESQEDVDKFDTAEEEDMCDTLSLSA